MNKFLKNIILIIFSPTPFLTVACSNQKEFAQKHREWIDSTSLDSTSSFNKNILKNLSLELQNEVQNLQHLQNRVEFSATNVPHYVSRSEFIEYELTDDKLMRIIMTIPWTEAGTDKECAMLSDQKIWNNSTNWFSLMTGGEINSPIAYEEFKKKYWSSKNNNNFPNINFDNCDYWAETLQGFLNLYSKAKLIWYNEERLQGEVEKQTLVLIYSKESRNLYSKNQESALPIINLLGEAFAIEHKIIDIEKLSSDKENYLNWKTEADHNLYYLISLINQGSYVYPVVIASLKDTILYFNKELEKAQAKLQIHSEQDDIL